MMALLTNRVLIIDISDFDQKELTTELHDYKRKHDN